MLQQATRLRQALYCGLKSSLQSNDMKLLSVASSLQCRLSALRRPPHVVPGSTRASSTSTSDYYRILDKTIKGSATAGRIQQQDLPFIDTVRAEALLKARMHIGHHRRTLHRGVSGAIYGFRHNVAIFDISKTWKSLRTIFYGFAEMAQHRSSFFLLAPNPKLPLGPLIEKMRNEYPFKHNSFSSLYMTGYSDQKWIKGIFSNWKVTFAYQEALKRRLEKRPSGVAFNRYSRYLKGVEDVDLMAKIVPDFVLVFAPDRHAAHEARNLDLPMVGMVDSNTDPLPFLYPVYGNDDSLESLQFMMDLLKRAIEEGRKREHEAFSMMLLQKVKASLHPQLADKVPTAEACNEESDDLLSGENDDELEPWEKYIAAAMVESERPQADFDHRAAEARQAVRRGRE